MYFTDIVKNQSRAAAGSQKCSTVYWFLFKLDSEPGDRQLSLSNANLRVYLNTIKRHLVENQNVSVGISTIVSLNEIGSGNFSSPIDDTWVYMRSIEVNSNSDGWLELNITEELGSVWDPDFTTREPIFNITLKFDVDCKQQKKVPLKITNPATIREFKAKRERQLEHQPFLAVYTTDDEILKMAKTRSYYYSNDVPVTTDEAEERRKRNAQTTVNSTCHIDDFTVRFSDLYLHHILWPETVKIQRCVGSCAYKYIHSASSLTTNHARILITSHLLYQIHRSNNPNTTIAEPLLPCCTPVKYRPIFLITAVGYYSFESNLYLDFIVEQCGCR